MNSLFSGSLFFVQVEFTIENQQNKIIRVSDADMATAISYATQASVPISLYATQYGDNSIAVSQQVVPYKVSISDPSFNDSQLQEWVNDIAAKLPNDSCVVILLPPAIDNSSNSRTQGTGGYHGFADVPYINSYISNDTQGSTTLTVQDTTFRYAGALSHEIAEMVVDPKVDGKPEVCDPCGPNYVSTYLSYFDNDGNYLITTQTPPYQVVFKYNFYINGIVQPAFAKPEAAPASACSYSPISVGLAPLFKLTRPTCCDGFFSNDDKYRHAIVGSRGGDIFEIFFSPNEGQGVALLATHRG